SLPSAAITSSPNAARIGSIAAPPGAVSSCAMRSVSTTSTPSAANRRSTVDLPLPMPPVMATMNGRSCPAEGFRFVIAGVYQPPAAVRPGSEPVEGRQWLAKLEGEQAGAGEIGAERNRRLPPVPREDHEADPDHGAHHRREQDHRGQRGPAEPRADRREELEVAEAHAFLAGDEPEQPVHRP